jgi:DUF1680 family protein
MNPENEPNTNPQTPHKTGLTRRRMLQTLAAGAVAATAGTVLTANPAFAADAPPQEATPPNEPHPISPRVAPFALTDVRLLDGPFKDAQQRDEKYLLSLEPDRLLHNFRVNAGLTPKAPVYGGWESAQPWVDIRCQGHTLGHYLSACAMMHASTANDAFKNRCDYIVADLQECQKAGKTGLVCAFPDNAAQFDNIAAGREIVGVPWYTMHKIFAGLRDAYLFCNNKTALEILIKLSDWAIAATQTLSDAQFQNMLNVEHGGMNEVLADVYAFTNDTKYLTLAQRFCHQAILDPLSQHRDSLDGLHSNTQIPKVIGFQRLYMLTGQTNYQAAAQFFWNTVVTTRSFATGGNGDNEHFFPITDFPRHLRSAKTMETCCSHNMLKLTRELFTLEGVASYVDYYERTLYNAILASQDPDSGMMTYFQSTRPGYLKLYCTPIDSFWCCTGTGMENHAKYGDSIYFHSVDPSQPAALFVNLFIPSTLTWKEKGLTLTQTTQFPEVGKTKLEFTIDQPVQFFLNIRHPAWCKTATIKINGKVALSSENPGSHVLLYLTWKSGDIVEVDLPMTLHMEPLPGSTTRAAVVYGPIVLAGKLGTQGITPGADLHINERTIGTVLNDRIDVPTLVGEMPHLTEKIHPTDTPLTFQTNGLAKPTDLTLIPYYRIAHERYNLYWNIENPTG